MICFSMDVKTRKEVLGGGTQTYNIAATVHDLYLPIHVDFPSTLFRPN